MTKLFLHALLLIGIMSTHSASAQQPADEDLSLSGLAILAQLRNDIYIAAVYTTAGQGTAQLLLESDQRKRMELRVLTDRWSARSFASHWNQALPINNSEQQLAKFEREVRQFTSAVRGKLVPGDKVTIDYNANIHTQLSVDGVPLLTVTKDPLQFFQLLLRCWIGPRPPSSEFKNNILNLPGGAEANGLLARYEALLPVSGRNKTIMSWRKSNKRAAGSAATPPAEPSVKAIAPSSRSKAERAPAQAPQPMAASPTPTPTNVKKETRVAATPDTLKAAEAAKAEVDATRQQRDAPTGTPAAAVSRPSASTAAAAPKPKPTTAPAERSVIDRSANEAAQKDMEGGLLDLYKSNLLKRVYGYVIYPSRAIDRNQEGTVVLQVTVNRKGKVLKIKNDEPSRYRLLNSAATKAIKKASPFPAAPSKLKGSTFDLEFPIVFRIPGS